MEGWGRLGRQTSFRDISKANGMGEGEYLGKEVDFVRPLRSILNVLMVS